MRIAFLTLLALAGTTGLRAQTIGLPEVTPKIILTNTATPVTVTTRIADPTLLPNSVVLQQVDSTGKVLKVLGIMTDDGKNGDVTAGDTVFTLQTPLTLTDTTFLRVSAGFKGKILRTTCGDVPVGPVSAFVTDFTPEGIQTFLNDNNTVRTAAKFLERLPAADFKRDWIMMSDTDSSQTGTAASPRFIVPHRDATKVFGFELDLGHMGDKETVEYIQFDTDKNVFRFHSIDTVNGTVTKDAQGCTSCHSGPPKGATWPYPRPNWDAYDSWGGALPFNRDRIYQNSEEERRVKALLKGLQNDPIAGQLDLPAGITRACTGDVTITPDGEDKGIAPGTITVFYDLTDGKVTYPGKTADVVVAQGGKYLTMHSTKDGLTSDQGRGVALFDQFTALNATRVAQEIVDKPTDVVDIKLVALAIARVGNADPALSCSIDGTNLGDYAPKAALDAFDKYHGLSFADLMKDTLTKQQSLPKLKADQQSANLKGLLLADMQSDDANTLTAQLFLRSLYGAPSQGVPFVADQLIGGMIDREFYTQNMETLKITLFRYFLEPSQEPVDKWTMSLNGQSLDHSQTYTFGDLFDSNYVTKLVSVLGNTQMGDSSGGNQAKGKDKTCAQLAADSKDWFTTAITKNPDFFKAP